MAKYKKMMPPRNTVIRGQDHLLAYITPEEAALLKARGGSGEAGPMGIPQFGYGDDDDGGYGDGDSDTGGMGSGDPDTGGFGGGYGEDPGFEGGGGGSAQTETVSLGGSSGGGNKGSGSGGITKEQVEAMNAAQRAMQFTPYSQVINDPVYSGLTSAAIGLGGQDRRLAGLTRAQYNEMPSYMRNIYDKVGAYNFEFGPQGNVTGFYGPPGGAPFPMANILGKGIVSLTDMLLGPPMTEEDLALRSAYTGFGEGSIPDGGRDDGQNNIKPVNPVTGQCDAGYIFDEDLQACRLDTSGARPSGVGSVVPPADGAYARMGLLDVAPTGLPQFQQQYGAGFGTPQDFAAANLNFRRQGATYPEYFQRPPQLSGYTLLS